MANDEFPRVTDREIAAMFSHPVDAERFQPILNFDEAAALLRVPAETLRDWRSRGWLHGCCRRARKRVLFLRDRLVKRVFNEGLGEQ